MTNEELAARIQAGERELLPELWEQVRGFVAKMAIRRRVLSNGYGGIEVDDLIQAGFLAVCEAVERFDPDGEYKFTSYLGNCLKTAFSEAGGYRSNRQYHDPLHSCASLDTPLGDDPDGDSLADIQEDPSDAFEDVNRRIWLEQLRAAVSKAMDDLPPEQRETLLRRFWDGKTLTEIGAADGVPYQLVRQRESKALHTLRMRKHKYGLDQFIEEQTPYYYHVGVRGFNSTHTSAVEALAMKRERMAERWDRRARYSLDPGNKRAARARAEEWKSVAKPVDSGIMRPERAEEVSDVHSVGKIDREIYKCVTPNIVTDEVIITDERIVHIQERHPNDYERYVSYIPPANHCGAGLYC